MSLFRHVLGLDRSATDPATVDPHAPLGTMPAGDTASVRKIAAQLASLPPARARFVAAFAYLLGPDSAHLTGKTLSL